VSIDWRTQLSSVGKTRELVSRKSHPEGVLMRHRRQFAVGTLRRIAFLGLAVMLWTSPAEAETQYMYHTVFATSFVTLIDTDTSVPPAMPYWGGLNAADFAVTFAAWQGGLLPNWNFSDIVYHAILSTNSLNAKNRLSIVGPILNTRNVLVASSWDNLWTNGMVNPIEYDQYGNLMTGVTTVWTGTAESGVWSGHSAGDWNDPAQDATVGDVYSLDPAWIDNGTLAGSQSARLYGISTPRVSTLYGEYNDNGVVDAADYVMWRKNLGSSVTLSNDQTPGFVTQPDFDVWRGNFGIVGILTGGGASIDSASVPEQSSLLLLAIGAISLLGYRKAKSQG
jgi:hypothetical protein